MWNDPRNIAERLAHRRLQLSSAARRWRINHPGADNRTRRQPFIGIDGEGGGFDRLGRQQYLLMHAADAKDRDWEMFYDNEQLGTVRCLEFLLRLPADAILVGYYFTYDATQILRDLSTDKITRIFNREISNRGEKHSHYVFFKTYAIEFIPGQYFRVARIEEYERDKWKILEGTARTVNEVGGFFQKSFVETIKSHAIGDPATIAMIAENKDRRALFTVMDQRERDYCAAECRLLAQLMEQFRASVIEADMAPASWRGAGALAAALHRTHNTPQQKMLPHRSGKLRELVSGAYYGGRFEVLQIGRIPGPVWSYDIHSAYPDAMRRLPCPIHTIWRHFDNRQLDTFADTDVFVARVAFRHNVHTKLCSFPVREKGRLFWPSNAQGIYWSPEIRSAVNAGASVRLMGGYLGVVRCNCRNFDWLNELYLQRQRLGADTRGYPIKIGIAALYGKLAQRLGGAPYRDLLAAGLVTALCRAKLIDAYVQYPDDIIMLATDALFSRKKLALDLGDGLGQWEEKVRPTGMFVVQPGIYWSPGSDLLPKTRGIPRSQIIAARDVFEVIWDMWCRGDGSDTPPTVTIPIHSFIGHRLALARGKPELAGCWLPNPHLPKLKSAKEISFDWSQKRDHVASALNGLITTMPHSGGIGLVSETYDPALLTELHDALIEREADPDFAPWGNSGE